jgi:hypothetical protein
MADAVLLLHLGVVLFVIGGLLLTLIGAVRGWRWVRNPWFRVTHLASIGFVVLETWFGVPCPLTTLESWLRVRAGGAAYEQGFIEHWIGGLLFNQAPSWVFAVVYTLFAAAVVATWRYYPPDRFGRRRRRE